MTELSTLRLWHPSFDAYHCSHRLLRLLVLQKDHALTTEKLCVLDFYLLYPFLLHRASMPREIRRDFRHLGIPKPESQFIQFPSEQSLYRELAIYQKAAATNLVAKGILAREPYLSGTASLRSAAIPETLLVDLNDANRKESGFMNFLVNEFGSLELVGPRGLRVLTGLVGGNNDFAAYRAGSSHHYSQAPSSVSKGSGCLRPDISFRGKHHSRPKRLGQVNHHGLHFSRPRRRSARSNYSRMEGICVTLRYCSRRSLHK